MFKGRLFFLFVIFYSVLGFSFPALAQKTNNQETTKVGVYISPPFVMHDKDGGYYGMAISLWEDIEKKLGLEAEYVLFHSFGELEKQLENGKIDIAVTNMTVTYERAQLLKFSYPWYDSGMRIMVKKDHKTSVFEELKRNGQFKAYGWISVVLIALAFLLTFVRRRLDNGFSKSWAEGVSMNFYDLLFAARSGNINCGYLGWYGYLVASVWMIFGVAVVAYVTSTITSAMTTVSLKHEIRSIYDLAGKDVGVFTGSVAEQYLNKLGLKTRAYAEIEDISKALTKKEVRAVVADAPVLEYWAHKNPELNFAVVGEIFHKDKYAFAAPKKNSPLIDKVSIEIIRLYETERIGVIKEMYFGNGGR